ncbi:MAG TPA: CBS domain-containing protein [Syntrophomonadaceae bacterium]|nr:CBS domain-containing protein [Syntrophomonadaceae bacterium]
MKVRDIMITRLITVDDRKSIDYALNLMHEYAIRRIPVVAGSRLLGIIVQHDIEAALRRPGTIPESPVDWIMTKNPITTGPETDLVDAIELLITHKISSLPVVESGVLVGMLSEIDLLKYLARLLHSQAEIEIEVWK